MSEGHVVCVRWLGAWLYQDRWTEKLAQCRVVGGQSCWVALIGEMGIKIWIWSKDLITVWELLSIDSTHVLGTVITITSINLSDPLVSRLSRKNSCCKERGLQGAPEPGAVRSIKRARWEWPKELFLASSDCSYLDFKWPPGTLIFFLVQTQIPGIY